MSLQGLVEAECGAANPLMQLANQVHTSNLQQRELGFHTNGEQQQIMPQTFNMQSLLDGMQSIEQDSSHSSIPPIVHGARPQQVNTTIPGQTFIPPPRQSKLPHPVHFIPPSFQSTARAPFQATAPMQYSEIRVMKELARQEREQQQGNEARWAHEYLDEVESTSGVKTACEILDLFESEQAEVKAQEERQKDVIAEDWADEYEKEKKEDNGDVLSNIHEEMAKEIEGDVEYWQKLQNDWTDLFQHTQFQNEEEAEVNGYEKQYNIDYDFEKNNPFNDISGAFEKGVERLKEGDLISAILLFEEAVRVNPDHVEAWQYLGTSQAENEQEVLAIRALNKCLALQPDNLVARMNLAVSYTNEYLQVEAYKALKAWIQQNPAYSHLITNLNSDVKSSLGTSFLSNEMFEEIKNLFISAAQIAPKGSIDAEVQVGLGVIFNLSGEYNKAVDCFQAALQAQPNSAFLWNKLGATLANSSRSAEAIPAYRKALTLRPGFIRCRYNIGISCINMKAYPEAIKHFLTALNMQREGEDPTRPVSTMSENIWSTLRMTISLLGRLDLMNCVEKRDLKALNNEFKMNSN